MLESWQGEKKKGPTSSTHREAKKKEGDKEINPLYSQAAKKKVTARQHLVYKNATRGELSVHGWGMGPLP